MFGAHRQADPDGGAADNQLFEINPLDTILRPGQPQTGDDHGAEAAAGLVGADGDPPDAAHQATGTEVHVLSLVREGLPQSPLNPNINFDGTRYALKRGRPAVMI
jgi:hypothetical protein